MSTTKSKEQILQDNGYKYNFHRMIYFNKTSKKIFSYEAIDDNDEAWLQEKVHEANKQEWKFYFNNPQPSQLIKDEIIDELK